GKKNREAMAKLKPEFVEGCRRSGTNEQLIEDLWRTNEKSADYSFNKSHAACYALIAYRTAWLKANHPAEYMAALISSVMDTKDKVPFFVAKAEEMGIEILPPDVNLSDHEFVVVEGNIRFGLDAVKGVGFQAVEAIKRARDEGGPFESIWDFCCRVDCRAVNKRAIEALIKCGAFGSTRASRRGMLAVLEQAQAAGSKQQQDAQIGQGSIFDMAMGDDTGAAAAFAAPSHPPIPPDEFDQPDLLALEKESIGVFISAHPLKQVREALRVKVDASLTELQQYKDGDWVTAGGIITQAKKIRTKKGDQMMFATLDDLEGSIEILLFANALEQYEGALGVDEVVLVRGKVDHKDADKTCLVVQSVEPFRPTEAEVERAREEIAKTQIGPVPFHLRVDASRLPASAIEELKEILGNFPGDSDVVLEMATRTGRRTFRLGPSYRVSINASLKAELDHHLGAAFLPSTPTVGQAPPSDDVPEAGAPEPAAAVA
ncbi:MAG TPA: OB-fold nucleic acid binding domain-containing protein, partial [Actinomycetota bacterium]|nr:OB-fold nucleic acid binding domain-containing protein [Actinomycetota bacterium]